MTKKEELVWRLGKLPNVEEITSLIANKIITQEEARDILFNKKIEEERDVKSLETEIKFLRDLVEKLSQSRSQIVEIIKEVKTPYYQWQWYQPYQKWQDNIVWCATNNTLQGIQTDTLGNCSFNSIQTW